MLADRNWTLDHLLQASGWDFERAVFVKDMAKLLEGGGGNAIAAAAAKLVAGAGSEIGSL